MTYRMLDPSAHYRSCFGLVPPDDGWLERIRREALERFAESGFPTTRQEDWKYTNTAPLAKIPFRMPSQAPESDVKALLAAYPLLAPGDAAIVFVNGRYRADLSNAAHAQERAVVSSFRAARQDGHRGLVAEHLTRYASYTARPFVALNTAFVTDGALVSIPEQATIERPIHLIFLTEPGAEPIFCQPRALILAGAGSRASVLEHHLGEGDGEYFSNSVSEIALGDRAQLDHFHVARPGARAFHVSTVQARQGRESVLRSYSLSLGGRLVRNDLDTVLAEEGAQCALSGLYLAAGSQHVDNHTTIEHAAPNSTSEELYSGVLGGRATGVFNGKVIVRPEAQKTSARQKNRNLLLSNDAAVNSKPQLEIFADDVRCTHAATVGRIDEDALFYLRSRGVAIAAARQLLIRAFASEITSGIQEREVKAALTEVVSEILSSDEWVEER